MNDRHEAAPRPTLPDIDPRQMLAEMVRAEERNVMSETELDKGMRHLRTAQDGLRKATSNMGSPVLRAAVSELINAVEEVNLAVSELDSTKDAEATQLAQIKKIVDEGPSYPSDQAAAELLKGIKDILHPKTELTVGCLMQQLMDADPKAVVLIKAAGLTACHISSISDGTTDDGEGGENRCICLYSDELAREIGDLRTGKPRP